VYLEEAHLWVWLLDDIIEFICDIFNSFDIPLPDIPIPLFRKDDIKFNDGKRWVSMKQEWGDIGNLFHGQIHMPVSGFCFKRTKTWRIKYDYDKLKKMFYKRDKKFWDMEERNAREMREEEDE